MKKRLVSLFLVLTLVLDMFPAAAFAVEGEQAVVLDQQVTETAVENSIVDERALLSDQEKVGGIIEITNQEALANMGTGTYKLGADIALDANWSSMDFFGTLDGNGHTITLNGKPLFNKLSGTVTNLLLEGQVTGNGDSLGVVANSSSGVIRNAYTNVTVDYKGFSYTGGFIGEIVGGNISTCLAAGTIKAPSFADAGGIAGANPWSENSTTIDNCYWASTYDHAAPKVSATNSRKVTTEEVSSTALAASLNQNLQAGDLPWGLTNGVLVPGGKGAPVELVINKDGLNNEIIKANALIKESYTAETWADFQIALAKAEEVSGNNNTTQIVVDEVLAALIESMKALKNDLSSSVDRSGLKAAISAAEAISGVYTADTWQAFQNSLEEAKKNDTNLSAEQNHITQAAELLNAATAALVARNFGPIDLTGKQVVTISTESQLEAAFQQPSNGKYFRLANDIEIKGQYWFGMNLNGVLDGNGHVITLPNTAIFENIGPEGIVQNLGVKGKAYSNWSEEGSIAKKSSGLIINSWSLASVTSDSGSKKAGGLVSKLESGGVIINSYAAGTVSAKGATGGLVGEADQNSLLKNSYWLDTMGSKAIGAGNGQVVDSIIKTRKDFYSKEFIALLNQNRNGAMEWNLSSEKHPYHGEPQEFVPEDSVEINFTSHTGDARKFQSEDGFRLSLLEIGALYKAGTLSYTGAAHWTINYADSGGKKPIMVGDETGELYVYDKGSAEVIVSDASWKVLAKFTIVAEQDEVKGLRFSVGDKVITDGKLTIQGSEQVTLTPQVEVEGGKWKSLPSGLFTYTDTGSIHRVGNTFYAKEPGSMTVTATGFGKTTTVTVISEYVPVTKIEPTPRGKFSIHERNGNSSSMGDFLDLNLAAQTGNVVVEPENASYRDNWTLTSSDAAVAEYVSSFLLAVLPKKAGAVTLTATTKDPRMAQQVSGSSKIELNYLNPLTKVAIEKSSVSVKKNEKMTLPLTFTGTKSATDQGYKYVTETGMQWSFSGKGKIEIVRSPLGMIVGSSGSKEYVVANDKYEMIGVTAGVVEVTGTPIDQTGGAKSVTFTVTVEQGETGQPTNPDVLVKEGIQKAQNYLVKDKGSYQYGEEWDIFALARTGAQIDPHISESYVRSILTTYRSTRNASDMKPTTLARVVLALGVLGKDASNLEGLNFIEMITSSGRIAEGGNEPAWALIALDSRKYKEPAHAKWNRNQLISELLTNYQNGKNGGFGLTDNETTSVDITAMAIQALAPYYNTRQDVKKSVDQALVYLKSKQTFDCGFDGNVEAPAQVLIALTALGKDPLDKKNGFTGSLDCNLMTNMMSFMDPQTGGFKHTAANPSPQRMSTIQALSGFDAYRRYKNGDKSIYDLTDVGANHATSRVILEARLANANLLVAADYTEKSWALFEEAKKNAQMVLGDRNATDVVLKKADEELETAIANLTLNEPNKPNPDGKMITVSFRLVGDTEHNTAKEHENYVNWIRTSVVTLPEGSTVYDVLEQALGAKGMHFVERPHNYISDIQAPSELGSYWLGEFDNGPGSGWKYLVNGTYPDVGLRNYVVNDSDAVVWRYVDDYSMDFDNSDKWQEAEDVEPEISDEKKPEVKPEIEEIVVNGNQPFVLDEKFQTMSTTPIILNFGDKKELPQITALRGDTLLEIEQGTKVISDWDGKLQLPTSLSISDFDTQQMDKVLRLDGKKVSEIDFRLKVGGAQTILFDRHVKLIFKGRGDKEIGFIDHEGNFKWIKKYSTSAARTDNEYAYRSGNDLILLTNHLTEFVTFSVVGIDKPIEDIDKPVVFTDIGNSWAKEYIEKAVSMTIIKGYSDGTFKPNKSLTRAQAASIIVRGLNLKADKPAPFKDIEGYSKETQAEIAAAYQHGIIIGQQGNFNPNDEVTRAQLALMLYRAYLQQTGDTYIAMQTAPYPDLGGYDDETIQAISMLYELEIATGSAGKYKPAAATTRAQAAKMFVNFFTIADS